MNASSSDTLEAQIDLRAVFGPVRDQGARNSCLSCATSDAHAHAHGLTHALSAEFLFHHAGLLMPGASGEQGLSFSAVDQALKTEGQPAEAECPYQITDADSWVVPRLSQRWYGTLADGAHPTQQISTALQQGRSVLLAIQLIPQFLTINTAPYIVTAAGMGFGAHAVLAVGLSSHPTLNKLTLIRNSWGTAWGDAGHAWLAEDYLAHYMIGFRLVAQHQKN
jgi:C1A family cysteine protease